VQDEILLHERQEMAPPGWLLRLRLRRALRLYARVLELIPGELECDVVHGEDASEVEWALEWMKEKELRHDLRSEHAAMQLGWFAFRAFFTIQLQPSRWD
jgi:hypothetical protein